MLRDTARKLLLLYIVVNVITNPVDLASGKSSQFSEILVLYYSAPTEFAVISDFMTWMKDIWTNKLPVIPCRSKNAKSFEWAFSTGRPFLLYWRRVQRRTNHLRSASMLRDTARKLLLSYLVVDSIINPIDLASGKSSRCSEIFADGHCLAWTCLWVLTLSQMIGNWQTCNLIKIQDWIR